MVKNSLDELPRKARGLLGQSRTKRAAIVGLARIGAIEVDLEKRLKSKPPGRMTATARRSRAHAAVVEAPWPMASMSRVATERSATSIARRIMFARARPWVTTDTPATPRRGAEAYGS